jgi:peptidoglycan/LPS O-acetylase OafA/YrhL
MEQLKGLPLGRQLILGAGILLLLDSFLDWQHIDTAFGSGGQSAWHGFWGIVMVLALLVLLAWVGAKAFGVEIPVNIPDGLSTLVVAALILVCAILKALTDDFVHWPAYVGIILAAVITYGGWLIFQSSGEGLPSVSRASAGGAAAAGSSEPAASTPPPPPAETAPEPPATDSSSDPA